MGLPTRPISMASQVLSFLLVLSTAYMMWKGLSVLADSKSPIVVVLSGSMEPAFQRGDLLFLWNRDGILPSCWTCEFFPWLVSDKELQKEGILVETERKGRVWSERKDVNVGEIVVYEVRGKDIPIVHRVSRRYPVDAGGNKATAASAENIGNHNGWLVRTKGDNNAIDDVELYARGQTLLNRDTDIIGSVVGFVPGVGYGTILLSEYPWLKTALLVGMGFVVVLQRE